MSSMNVKSAMRARRKLRGRKKISGTPERPRMSVFRSARHVFVQVVDDNTGKTLVSVGTFAKGKAERANKDVCAEVGKTVAAKCKEKNITKVVFDKNGYTYHGRIKALADGAREAGLDF
jgi:large subunit ribosomal protein L18